MTTQADQAALRLADDLLRWTDGQVSLGELQTAALTLAPAADTDAIQRLGLGAVRLLLEAGWAELRHYEQRRTPAWQAWAPDPGVALGHLERAWVAHVREPAILSGEGVWLVRTAAGDAEARLRRGVTGNGCD